mgnify:CR=1 FL=1
MKQHAQQPHKPAAQAGRISEVPQLPTYGVKPQWLLAGGVLVLLIGLWIFSR